MTDSTDKGKNKCRTSPQGLNPWAEWCGRRRHLLQDDDHSGFSERSSVGPRFSTFMFLNVPGKVPECTRTCGFWRTSSNLDIAPRIGLSVLLSSSDNFFVTLRSISFDTSVMHFAFTLGMVEF